MDQHLLNIFRQTLNLIYPFSALKKKGHILFKKHLNQEIQSEAFLVLLILLVYNIFHLQC